MKYSIGEIVILISDKNIMNRYIIIATEEQVLNQHYLNTLSGRFNIKDFKKLAEREVKTTLGFRYVICKCSDSYSDGLCVLEGKFIDIMDDNEIAR